MLRGGRMTVRNPPVAHQKDGPRPYSRAQQAGWPISAGTGGGFGQESVAVFPQESLTDFGEIRWRVCGRNRHRLSGWFAAGIGGRFGREYALA
jgi:hypothetical protein